MESAVFSIPERDELGPARELKKAPSPRLASHSRTSLFGAVPSDFRPTTPDRRICTYVRNIRALSITRANTAACRRGSRADSQAHNSAGMSLMEEWVRLWAAIRATYGGST